jgi:serine/threonine protein kinase
MSPELFENKRKVRPTMLSDVWAYGCVALQVGKSVIQPHMRVAIGLNLPIYPGPEPPKALPHHQVRLLSAGCHRRGACA